MQSYFTNPSNARCVVKASIMDPQLIVSICTTYLGKVYVATWKWYD